MGSKTLRNFVAIPDRPRNLCVSFTKRERVFFIERAELFRRLSIEQPLDSVTLPKIKSCITTTIPKYGLVERPAIVDGVCGVIGQHLILPATATNFEFICDTLELPSKQVLSLPIVILFDKE